MMGTGPKNLLGKFQGNLEDTRYGFGGQFWSCGYIEQTFQLSTCNLALMLYGPSD